MKLKTTCLAALLGLMAGPALADTLQLSGTIRDVKRGDQSGGHPDFQTAGSLNRFGLVPGLVTMELGADRKPVFNSVRPSKDTIKSADSLAQWYNDTSGVNMAIPFTLTLDNNSSTPGGIYTYKNTKFWPINGQGFGNQGLDKNFHFTFELHTKFTYVPGQKFTFIGDDDVWVYINGLRVIDIGGVHAAETANVLLFDGKAFVTKAHFPLGGKVKEVTSSMATQLASKWVSLGLSGTSPIVKGDRYVEIDFGGDSGDVTCSFTDTTVTPKASAGLEAVVIKFNDGSVQKFENLTGSTGTFAGTGAYSNKPIVGAWVKTGVTPDGSYGDYYSPSKTGPTCTLDFFFAERHTTESNFRIDTSILLESQNLTALTPAYD